VTLLLAENICYSVVIVAALECHWFILLEALR